MTERAYPLWFEFKSDINKLLENTSEPNTKSTI